jgi:rhodanese-related sulfurtransferase
MNAAGRTGGELRALAVGHYDQLARIGHALSSPARLRLLDLLRQGPRSVDALAQASGLSVANTSQHLKQLLSARLVLTSRDGQRVVYRVSDATVSILFAAMRDLAEVLLPELDRLRDELGGLPESDREAILARITAKKVTLIDVRPAEEFQAGHVPGAISIPLAELTKRLSEIPRSKEIVAYCRGPYCSMALEAVQLLEAAGFRARHLDLGAPDLSLRKIKLELVESAPKPRTSSKSKRRK